MTWLGVVEAATALVTARAVRPSADRHDTPALDFCYRALAVGLLLGAGLLAWLYLHAE